MKRLIQHNNNKGNKFTGQVHDWQLKAVYQVGGSRNEAIRIESFIKNQKSRRLIERMIQEDFIPIGRLALLVRVPHMRD